MGHDEATIDDKGRILFGRKRRERLGDEFVLVLGTVGNLVAYSQEVWNQRMAEIFAYPSISQGREAYSRLVFGFADDEVRFDGQNRAVIPMKLRDLAKLKDRVLLIGMGDRLEIWAAEEWEKFNQFPKEYGKDRREAIEKAYQEMVGGSAGAA